MTDLVLLLVTVLFVAVGFLSPFVLSLGYVWVDTLLPQRLSYSLLSTMPLAFIMGAGAVLSYLMNDRRDPPRITMVQVLAVVMALWITLTTTWAVAPIPAWIKWDPSFKTVIFTAFMPFVFRSRIQIESFVLVLIMAAAAHLLPWGFKTIVSGGGYEQSLGLMSVNSTFLAESSAVSTITVMFIPLLWWIRAHSLLIPGARVKTAMAAVMTGLYLIANIGTFARTGLVAIAVIAMGILLRTRRKVLFIAMAVVIGGGMTFFMSSRWEARISTITDYEQESSANDRLLIWQWTLGFAATHPLGGGFDAYVVNIFVRPDGSVQRARAFHNIYFATLGQHGFPGLAIYLAILGGSLLSLQKVMRRCRDRAELAWAGDLARASQLGLVILMVCGNFIDISFNFIIWDMVALAMCLNAHVARVLAPVKELHPSMIAALPDGRGRTGPGGVPAPYR